MQQQLLQEQKARKTLEQQLQDAVTQRDTLQKQMLNNSKSTESLRL